MKGLKEYITEALNTDYSESELKNKKVNDILETIITFDWEGEKIKICRVVSSERVSNTEFKKIAINVGMTNNDRIFTNKLYGKTKPKLKQEVEDFLSNMVRMRPLQEVKKELNKK